jgi:hypothetical protein
MTDTEVRHVTLDIHGDLVDLKNDSYIDYSSLQSESVESISKGYADISESSDYSNEIFINFYVKRKEWSLLLLETDVLVASKSKNCDSYIWNDIVEKKNKSVIEHIYSFVFAVSYLPIAIATAILFPWYLFFKSINSINSRLVEGRDICVVRSKASFDKIRAISRRFNIQMISEGVVYKNESLNPLSTFVGAFTLLRGYPSIIYGTWKDLYLVKRELLGFLGNTCTNRILFHYATRIVLKCSYEILLEDVIKRSRVNLFTGNKEDRFAMVESRVARKNAVQLICIPHGLEYAFRFPNGVAGDIFYCTSNASALSLAKIYDHNKFVFDQELNDEIYGKDKVYHKDGLNKIVFFTEPRNIQVNRLIIKLFQDNKIAFSIRLHPVDRRDNYSGDGLDFITNFSEVLSFSTWIARKSTVLVEALYKEAESIAILVDSKDVYYANYIFPSLSEKKIKKVYSASELLTVLH